MKRVLLCIVLLWVAVLAIGCDSLISQESRDEMVVEKQQSQYAKLQPIPAFNFSLERHLVSQLYKIRNQRVATHSVWRSDFGKIEGDCPSMGFGLPYDTSLTNPLQPSHQGSTIEQAEPNGIFASKNTAATWVMCVGKSGVIEPMYVETKVTVYPGPVTVDYVKNIVTRLGAATVKISDK